jgi:hypothetical protein
MVSTMALAFASLFAVLTVHAASPADDAFFATWARTDLPVATGRVSRTWMWGPEPFTEGMYEPYFDSRNGVRLVQYFDKTRMELNTRERPDSPWYVTNGLLAKELVTGQRQLGDALLVDYGPAAINVAGDADDPTGPTYASFSGLLRAPAYQLGHVITETIDRSGTVGNDPGLAALGVTAAYYVPETRHTVASVFWDFMRSRGLVVVDGLEREAALFPDPFYATGLPLTEAYWTTVRVAGTPQRVLIQVFERRVLTYTPDNPRGWQVEAGNVGQHYYAWHYQLAPDIGTRENPIPRGHSARLYDNWEVRVVRVIPDATSLVLAENIFNRPPARGKQFFIATVEATYRGPGSSRFDGSFRLRAVGPSGVSYSTFNDFCGVIPDELPDPEVFTGGTIRGNVCWQVTAEDAGALLMYDDPFTLDAVPRVYFRLTPSP